MTKHAGLPFDAILSTELARTAKPAPAAFQLGGRLPSASRPSRSCSWRATSTTCGRRVSSACGRPSWAGRTKFGPDGDPDATPEPWCDLNVADFLELAEAMGC